MLQQPPKPEDLVRTEAEPVPPPHDVTVPEPQAKHQAAGGAGNVEPEILRELQRLAERVGGLEKLKEVVDVLIRLPR
jgi:hypothetical protein